MISILYKVFLILVFVRTLVNLILQVSFAKFHHLRILMISLKPCVRYPIYIILIILLWNLITNLSALKTFIVLYMFYYILYKLSKGSCTLRYNLTLFLFLACAILTVHLDYMVQNMLNGYKYFLFLFISTIIWVVFSLLSNEKTAKLSNELITGFATIIFSITSTWKSEIMILDELLQLLATPLIFFIGITILGVSAINIRRYVVEKYFNDEESKLIPNFSLPEFSLIDKN